MLKFKRAVSLAIPLVIVQIVIASGAQSETAGHAVGVRPSASLANGEGTVRMAVGAEVQMGDRVRTNSRGEVQLKFTDNTKLVVGPNSSLVIEKYLLRSRNRANNLTIRALGGTFRMISGKSRKQAYRIKTPTATIGIRGTSFDLSIRNGETNLLLYSGSARMCGTNGRCTVITGRCSLAKAPRRGSPGVEKDRRAASNTIRRQFRYARSQGSLRRDFRVRQTGCADVARAPINPDPRARNAPRGAPVQEQAAPPAPEPEPQSEGPTGNRGHGNGNEGDVSGADGNDPDNPGRGGGRGNNNAGGNGRGNGNGRS